MFGLVIKAKLRTKNYRVGLKRVPLRVPHQFRFSSSRTDWTTSLTKLAGPRTRLPAHCGASLARPRPHLQGGSMRRARLPAAHAPRSLAGRIGHCRRLLIPLLVIDWGMRDGHASGLVPQGPGKLGSSSSLSEQLLWLAQSVMGATRLRRW